MTTLDLLAELDGQVRGLTRAEYDVLVEQGVFTDIKVELLRGQIVEMSPTCRPHGLAVQWLNMWLARRLPEDLHVRVQSGMAATEDSEPEPDLIVCPADWAVHERIAHHPTGALLVVEVAESSLRRDLRIKAGIYAEAAVPAYWVFDVAAREMVIHRDPVDGSYTDVQRVGDGVLDAAGVAVPMAELLAFTFPTPNHDAVAADHT